MSPPFSLSKKCILPAKRAFEIHFLTQLCRVKKYFYPSKCVGWRRSRQDVRAAGMFGGKVTLVTFSTVSREGLVPSLICLYLKREDIASPLFYLLLYCFGVMPVCDRKSLQKYALLLKPHSSATASTVIFPSRSSCMERSTRYFSR